MVKRTSPGQQSACPSRVRTDLPINLAPALAVDFGFLLARS